jgi:multiple sugar transport system substrate-binding protein
MDRQAPNALTPARSYRAVPDTVTGAGGGRPSTRTAATAAAPAQAVTRRTAALAAAATPVALAACGPSGAPAGGESLPPRAKGPVTIQVMDWGTPEHDEVNKRFTQANAHVTVVRMTPTAGQERHLKFETTLAAGEPPDLFWMDAGRTGDFREKKILRLLDPLIKRDKFDIQDFFPAAQSIYQFQGQNWGVLFDVAPWLLVYNKTLFEQKAVKPPTETWTWNDLREAMLRLTSGGTGEDATFGGAFSRRWATQTFVYQNGGKVVDDLFTPARLLLDTKEALEGINFHVDLYVRHNAAVEDKEKTGGFTAGQLWEGGRLGLNFTSIWSHRKWTQTLPFDWDQMPPQQQKQRATIVSSAAYIIPQLSKFPEEAWGLLKQLNGREAHTLFAGTGTIMPGRRSVTLSDAFLKVPKPANMRAFVQIMDYAKPPQLVHPLENDFRKLWDTSMAPVWEGRQAASTAMTEMARQANAMFEAARK